MNEIKNCNIKCEHYKALGPYMFQCMRPEMEFCPCDPTGALMEPPITDEEQAAKADAGKLQLHLVPMQIVRDICEVREYGNRKYGDPNNWRQVEIMRYVDALLRHTLAFAEDIHSVDEESGIPHYKHMECNLAFISELMRPDRPAMTGEDRLLRDISRECEDHDRSGGKTAASAGD